MEQSEQTAAGERALERTGKRGRERLAHRRAREVGEDAVGGTAELQLAGSGEADQRILWTAARIREGALGGGGGVIARAENDGCSQKVWDMLRGLFRG
jgi:hypothetical protein